jgi:hypothetical protein
MAIKRLLIKEVDKKYLLTLKSSDITLKLLKELLAFNEKNIRRFNPVDEIILIPEELETIKNELSVVIKDRTTTTVGRYILNLFLFANINIRDKVVYYNMPINKGNLGKIFSDISILLKENKIDGDTYIDFINRLHWFSFSITSFIAYTLDLSTAVPLESVKKRKEELFKEHSKKIENNDQKIVSVIEKELIDLAKKELDEKDSNGLKVYDSGATGSFANNYKNTVIMRGSMAKSDAIADPSKMNISKSNLSEGIPLDEYSRYNDISVIASFSRAILTAEGGYMVKKFSNGFAHLNTNEERGSDCGTKYTYKVKITDKNIDQFYLRYALYNKNLVLLDKNNSKDAIGKTLELRSPLFCKDSKICNKCIGDLYYNLGVNRLGNLPSKLGSAHLNKALKRFHDLSQKFTKIDVLNSFVEI